MTTKAQNSQNRGKNSRHSSPLRTNKQSPKDNSIQKNLLEYSIDKESPNTHDGSTNKDTG